MRDNLPERTQQESWDDMLPVAASNRAIQRYNAVVDFAVNTLKFGTHYDVLPGEYFKCKGKSDAEILRDTNIKKFFTQAGADMTNMAWGVRGEAEVVHSVEQPDAAEPYFAYAIKVNLFHIGTGNIVGSAVGYCSSKEVKFRYRWIKETDIKDDPAFADVDISQCKSKVFGYGGSQTKKYRVINPDLGDIAPTIFMMAEKRGYVKATRRLYGISELFNQSLDSIEETLLTEIDDAAAKQPAEPEKGRLADADMKPGDPAKHQSVEKPQGQQRAFDDPPPPDDRDAPPTGKPTPRKVATEAGIEGDPEVGRYLKDFWDDLDMHLHCTNEGIAYAKTLIRGRWNVLEPHMITRTSLPALKKYCRTELLAELGDKDFLKV
jgi:hypothetical protein